MLDNRLGNNIRRLRNSKGLTQQKLAEMMGASNYTTVSKWESGSNSPRGGDLVKLSEYFKVSVDDLLGISEVAIQNDSSYTFMPASVSAGLPNAIDGIIDADKIKIPDAVMGKWAGHKDILIMRINGDSMDNIIPDGSMIAVKPVALDSLKNEDIVVFNDSNNEYSIKRFLQYDDELIFRPESSNLAHKEYRYAKDANVMIHGKVVLYIVELD